MLTECCSLCRRLAFWGAGLEDLTGYAVLQLLADAGFVRVVGAGGSVQRERVDKDDRSFIDWYVVTVFALD